MRSIQLAIAFVFVAAATPALAQEEAAPRPLRVGAEAAVVIPTGDWADISGIGVGPMGRLSYKVGPQVAITGRAGYIFHLGKELAPGVDGSTAELLLMGGAQFMLNPEIHVGVATGINSWSFKVSGDGGSESDSETRIPLVLDAGYAMPTGLMFGGGIILPNLLLTEDGEDIQFGIMATVGYNFIR